MSDGGFNFFINLPQSIEEAMDKQVMAHEEWVHGFFRSLSELDEDHLVLVRNTIALALNDKNSARIVLGHISTLLDSKYGYCVACGKNHDKEAEALAAESKEYPQDPSADPTGQSPFHLGDADAMRDVLMDNFEVYEKPEDTSGAVYCKNCDVRSVSLEDRMMKLPGIKGCDSCQQKQKWG
jgi:RNA polymerase-binding transcription factor DksA